MRTMRPGKKTDTMINVVDDGAIIATLGISDAHSISLPKQKILDKLEVVVPEVTFTDATLLSVIEWVREYADISIIIDSEAYPTEFPYDIPKEMLEDIYNTDTTSETEASKLTYAPADPRASDITLKMQNVPIRELLKYCLLQKGLVYRVEDYAVIVTVPIENRLQTQTFRIKPEYLVATDNPWENEHDIKTFLLTSGVDWPAGSSIQPIPKTGMVIIKNTSSQLEIIGELMSQWILLKEKQTGFNDGPKGVKAWSEIAIPDKAAFIDTSVYLNGERVPDEQLVQELKERTLSIQNPRVIIRAGEDIPHKRIVRVMSLIHEAGIENMALATSKVLQPDKPGIRIEIEETETSTPRLQFRFVVDDGDTGPVEILPWRDKSENREPPRLEKEILFDESDIEFAEAEQSSYTDDYIIRFEMKYEAAERFAQITGNNIGRRLALVFDGEIISAPDIRSKIRGRGTISGNLTRTEAGEIAEVLSTDRDGNDIVPKDLTIEVNAVFRKGEIIGSDYVNCMIHLWRAVGPYRKPDREWYNRKHAYWYDKVSGKVFGCNCHCR